MIDCQISLEVQVIVGLSSAKLEYGNGVASLSGSGTKCADGHVSDTDAEPSCVGDKAPESLIVAVLTWVQWACHREPQLVGSLHVAVNNLTCLMAAMPGCEGFGDSNSE